MIHIVIDLEMNPIKRDLKEVRKFLQDEVIEFGAVKLDENYQQFDTFQLYVKPAFCALPAITTFSILLVADESLSVWPAKTRKSAG